MKNFFFLLILIAIRANGQIAFETSYTNAMYIEPLGVVQLSAAGYKYAISDSDQIVLYNMNHSVYTTIAIPNQPPGSYSYRVKWISDELFNTNPADIEYALVYYSGNAPSITHLRIYDQSGTMLLSRDSVECDFLPYPGPGAGRPSYGVVHTASGVKLLLLHQFTYSQEIYSLPGVLPCAMCDQGVISGIQPQHGGSTEDQQQSNPYPNPTQSSITLPYTLPQGTSIGEMIIYDIVGREVKRFAITNAFSSLILETNELPAGNYSYSISTTQGLLPGNRFIVMH